MTTLERMGFEWDGPVWFQSARSARYDEALAQLIAIERAFPCACTRAERADDVVSAIGERVYPGTCRNGNVAAWRKRRAMRVRVDQTPIEFVDRLYGTQQQQLSADVGDFVVRRSDGLHAYQLAVVVDDDAQRITDVVRGADLLASTPRQILLQRLLGFATPRYLHVPVAIDSAGRKLSKATGAAALPTSPLPALAMAWDFLEQPALPESLASVTEFWTWAIANWTPRSLPRVAMRPAPPRIIDRA